MSRLLRLPILLSFLIAIASNCIQATQISFDQRGSLVTLLGAPPDAAQNEDLAFLVTDDDSDGAPKLMLAETEVHGIQPFRSFRCCPAVAVTAVQLKPLTVLRL